MSDKKPILKFKKLWSKLTDEGLAENDNTFVVIYHVSASRYYPVKRKNEEDITYGIYVDDEYLYDAIIINKRIVKRWEVTDEMAFRDRKTMSGNWRKTMKFRHVNKPEQHEFIYMVFKKVGGGEV